MPTGGRRSVYFSQFMKIPYESKGWHTRGYLPHYDGGEIAQFITFRLFDSVPKQVIDRWRMNLHMEKDEERKRLLSQKIDHYLDEGHGSCFLRDERIAILVQKSFLYFTDSSYRLWAWTIMPNHVHLLLTPNPGNELSKIIQSIKTFTSREANMKLGREGRFWHRDYFDRYIRDRSHFARVVRYIENNPVKAGLCDSPQSWPYTGTPTSGRHVS